MLLRFRHLDCYASHEDGRMFRRDPLGSVGRRGPAGRPPTGNQARHHVAFPSIAFLPNLLIEAGCIVATLIPACLEVGTELIHFRRGTMWCLPLRELSTPEPTPDGLPFNPKGAADHRLRMA